jgi:Ion channel
MIMVRDESPEQGAHAARRRPGRALLAKFVSADSYGLVLVLVVVTYLVSVSFVAGWAQSVVLAVQLATVWLTFRTARTPLSARVMVFVVFLAVAAVAFVNLFIAVTSEALAVAFVVSALLYVVAPFAVVRDIATRRSVDQEAVLGAIAAYLIVGMCFAFTYRAIGVLQPTPFFGAEGPGDMTQTLFFSFVTLTTTGYGNLVPATNPGQSLAVMEAVLGQLFLVTAVAKIITAWKPRRWRSPEDPD